VVILLFPGVLGFSGVLISTFIESNPSLGHLLRKDRRSENCGYTHKLFSEHIIDSQGTEFETDVSRMGVRRLTALLGPVVRLINDLGIN